MTAAPTCRGCGAQLAEDQRYCLNCGRRQGESRVDRNRREPAPAAAAPAPAAAGERPQRDYTPLAAVGGIAVLGAMLLIGVLIGKGEGGGTAATPAPVVVRGGAGGSGKGAAGEESGAASQGAAQRQQKSNGKGGGKGGSGGSSSTAGAPVVSDDALEKLQRQSPQEYSESSAKLPDEIATPGAPPPQDNKAPGGGSKGATIE